MGKEREKIRELLVGTVWASELFTPAGNWDSMPLVFYVRHSPELSYLWYLSICHWVWTTLGLVNFLTHSRTSSCVLSRPYTGS